MLKVALLIIVLLSFCPQQEKIRRVVVVVYRKPEVMYGKIKQLIEIRPNVLRGDKPILCPIDTTNFDEHGNSIETHLGVAHGLCIVITYYNKLDDKGRKLESGFYDNGIQKSYKYNINGELTNFGPADVVDDTKYHYNNSETAYHIIDFDEFGNWTKKVNFYKWDAKRKPDTTCRKIIYY